jgi:NAD+ diphosphatase
VREETSLTVGNLRYVGSQPWPYPNSLMLGFTADYVSGQLRFADGELTEGGFFDKNHLPPLPHKPSIARRMIEEWITTGKK